MSSYMGEHTHVSTLANSYTNLRPSDTYLMGYVDALRRTNTRGWYTLSVFGLLSFRAENTPAQIREALLAAA